MAKVIPLDTAGNMSAELDLTRPRAARLWLVVNGHSVRGVVAPNVVELRQKAAQLRPAAVINHLNETPPPPAAA